MGASVLIDTPITGPVGGCAVAAGGMPAAIVVIKRARHKVLIGLGAPDGEGHEHVVLPLRDGRPRSDSRRGARQPRARDRSVNRLRAAEHAFVFGANRQLGESADAQLNLKHKKRLSLKT